MKKKESEAKKRFFLTTCADTLAFSQYLMKNSKVEPKYYSKLYNLKQQASELNSRLLAPKLKTFVKGLGFKQQPAKNYVKVSLSLIIACPSLTLSSAKFFSALSKRFQHVSKQELINTIGKEFQSNNNIITPITMIDENYEPKSIHKALCILFSDFLDTYCNYLL